MSKSKTIEYYTNLKMKELPTAIVSRTTIEFKDRITRESLEDLFGYLAKELPLGEIKYSEYTTTYMGDRFFTQFKDRKAKRIERLSGIIASGENIVEFEMYKDQKTPYLMNVFDGLRFITTPGYEISELRKEEVELMDKTRTLVETAFS